MVRMKCEEHTPTGTSPGGLKSSNTKLLIIMLFKTFLATRERKTANMASFLKEAPEAIVVILHPSSFPSSLKNRINAHMEECD